MASPRVLRQLSGLCIGAAVLLAAAVLIVPLAVLLSETVAAQAATLSRARLSGVALPEPISPLRLALALGAALLPALAGAHALRAMARLFSGYARGDVLTPGAAEAIRQAGWGLLAAALASVFCHAAAVLILTVSGEGGSLSLRIGSGAAGSALMGAYLLVVGGAMREAARVAEDARSIV